MFPTIALLVSLVAPAAETPPPTTELAKNIEALTKAHKGKVAVAVKNLATGESYYLNADDVMPTASLIKFPIMIEAYYQAKEGKVKLDDMITLKKEDMVPGSGVLTDHFSPGLQLSLRDAIRLMMVYSDNTATNLVLDKVGMKAVCDRMETLDCKETKINSKVFKRVTSINMPRSEKYGLGSTSPREMIVLLEKLNKKELVSPEVSDAMLDHMKKCDDKEKFPRLLPRGVVVAHKTGSIDAARTDAGLIYIKGTGPIALAVMTNDNADKSWGSQNAGNTLCADVAKVVYDYFQAKATKSK
jgi:beta-lactamase class A